MARVLVTDDTGERVLLDEHVQTVHLDDEHSGRQVVERIAWAVADAEPGRGAFVPYRKPRPRRRATVRS
jgi:hypothetical protein